MAVIKCQGVVVGVVQRAVPTDLAMSFLSKPRVMDKSSKSQSEAKGQGLDTSSVFGVRGDKLEPTTLAEHTGKETLQDLHGFSDGGKARQSERWPPA